MSDLQRIAETALMTDRQEAFCCASPLVLRVMLTCPLLLVTLRNGCVTPEEVLMELGHHPVWQDRCPVQVFTALSRRRSLTALFCWTQRLSSREEGRASPASCGNLVLPCDMRLPGPPTQGWGWWLSVSSDHPRSSSGRASPSAKSQSGSIPSQESITWSRL